MKGILSISIALCLASSLSAQKALVFNKPVVAYVSASKQSAIADTIEAGRIAILNNDKKVITFESSSEGDCYDLSEPDFCEGFIVKEGWTDYFRPSQDDISTEYICTKDLIGATTMVNVSTEGPKHWNVGKTYILKSINEDSPYDATITPIRITEDIILKDVYGDIDNMKDSVVTLLKDKIVYAVNEECESPTYIFNNNELAPAQILSKNAQEARFWELRITPEGKIFAKDPEKGDSQPVKSIILCPDIPSIHFLGWISDNGVVINTQVYKVQEQAESAKSNSSRI